MDSSRFDRDLEGAGSTTMSQKPLNAKDGRRKVLIVGAGAAGYDVEPVPWTAISLT
jgi:hypothetical protein